MKVSLIAGVVAERDAISASLRHKALAIEQLRAGAPLDMRVYCHCSDVELHGLTRVRSVTELVLAPHFLESDLIVYEFGIYHDLFDSIHLAPAGAKKVIHFHNITPARLVPESARPTVARSFVQMANVHLADAVLVGSAFNHQTLLDYGVPEEKIWDVNYVVDGPRVPARRARPGSRGVVELVYVGRFVPSKGVLDAVHAVGAAVERGAGRLRLALVGNAAFSDPEYLARVKDAARRLPSGASVAFVTDASDEERDRCYARAHAMLIPSYHEGFCVPVVEALQRGCFVLAYDGGNLPHVVNGFGNVVPAGDVEALTDRLVRFVEGVRAEPRVLPADRGPCDEERFVREAREYTARFSFEVLKERLDAVLQEVAARTGGSLPPHLDQSAAPGIGPLPSTMSRRDDTGTALDRAIEEAEALAEPQLPSETPFRFAKQAVLRVLQVFARSQVSFNRAIVRALRELSATDDALGRSLERFRLHAGPREASAPKPEGPTVEVFRGEERFVSWLDGEIKARVEERAKSLVGWIEGFRKELFFELRSRLDERERLEHPEIVNKERYDAKVAAMPEGLRINLGAGSIDSSRHINVDQRALESVDVRADIRDLPFADGQVAELYLAHLIEHFTEHEVRTRLLPYWHRLLKEGGKLVVVCPDAEAMMRGWVEGKFPYENLREVTFGGQEYRGNDHRNMFTPASLEAVLRAAGFREVQRVAVGRPNGLCLEMELEAVK